MDFIKHPGPVGFSPGRANLDGMFKAQSLKNIDEGIVDRPVTASKKVAPFFTDHSNAHFCTPRLAFLDNLEGLAKNVGIEGAAQSTVACHD